MFLNLIALRAVRQAEFGIAVNCVAELPNKPGCEDILTDRIVLSGWLAWLAERLRKRKVPGSSGTFSAVASWAWLAGLVGWPAWLCFCSKEKYQDPLVLFLGWLAVAG